MARAEDQLRPLSCSNDTLGPMARKYAGVAALAVVVLVGGFLGFSQFGSPEQVLRDRLQDQLALSPTDTLTVSARSDDFWRLALHKGEGHGGGWVIVRHGVTSTQIIDRGQDFPRCALLEAADVPIDLEPECWAEDGATLVPRSAPQAP